MPFWNPTETLQNVNQCSYGRSWVCKKKDQPLQSSTTTQTYQPSVHDLYHPPPMVSRLRRLSLQRLRCGCDKTNGYQVRQSLNLWQPSASRTFLGIARVYVCDVNERSFTFTGSGEVPARQLGIPHPVRGKSRSTTFIVERGLRSDFNFLLFFFTSNSNKSDESTKKRISMMLMGLVASTTVRNNIPCMHFGL